jgi:hypothetical protein
MTPEGKVKAAVKKLLKKYEADIWTHWPVQTGYGAPTLDCTGSVRSRLYSYSGLAFAIETKTPGEGLTARQEATKAAMERGGVTVFVIGECRDASGDYSGMCELQRWLDKHTYP